MRTLDAAVKAAGAGCDFGDEVLIGTDCRPVPGAHFTGGVIDGPCHIRNAVDLVWDNPRQIDSGTTDTGWMFSMLGGIGWRINNLQVTGGQSLAQIQVGLDSTPGARKIPINWEFNGGWAINNGAGTIEQPRGHNFYVITDTGTDMKGVVRNMTFGPSLSGHAIKAGGTGSNPMSSEGVNGVTFVDCHVNLDHDLAGGVLLQGSKSRNVQFHNLTADRPILIDVNDGAQVQFYGPVVEGRTFVKYYLIPALHLFKRTTIVNNGRPAPGVSWYLVPPAP